LHIDQRSETLQGDSEFVRVLQEVGAEIRECKDTVNIPSTDPSATHRKKILLRVEASHTQNTPLKGVSQNFSDFSDTFLTLAAIAPLFNGPTKITGIAHTRKQETDRVAGMARELK